MLRWATQPRLAPDAAITRRFGWAVGTGRLHERVERAFQGGNVCLVVVARLSRYYASDWRCWRPQMPGSRLLR